MQSRRTPSGADSPAKGRLDFEELGGLDRDALFALDACVDDSRRRVMLRNWFGDDGARYAWLLYRPTAVAHHRLLERACTS